MTKVTVDAAAGLAAIPYLAPLSARERADLASRCLVKNVAKGKVIFAEGESATGLWVVLAGRVRLVRISPRGRERARNGIGIGGDEAVAPDRDRVDEAKTRPRRARYSGRARRRRAGHRGPVVIEARRRR